jgi:hypothetical protein
MLYMFSPDKPIVEIPPVGVDKVLEIIALEKQNYPDSVVVSADSEESAITLGEEYFRGEKTLSSVKYPNILGETIECVK